MANIKSVNGNPIVVGTDGIEDGAVTKPKLNYNLQKSLIFGLGYAHQQSTPITDLDSCARNTVVFITNGSGISNLPESNATGFVITIGEGTRAELTSVAVQIFVKVDAAATQGNNHIYYRYRYGAASNQWSEWQANITSNTGVGEDEIDNNLINRILLGGGYVASMATPYTDADQFPRNTVYYYTYGTPLANMPDNAQQGWIITVGDGTHTAVGNVGLQIVVSQAEAANPTKVDTYVRARYGGPNNTWSPWMKLANDNEVPKVTYGSVSMFESICGIGDSYMAGSTYVNEQWVQSVAKYSWTGALARRNGLRLTNLGAHGGTAYDFINSADGLPKVLSDIQDGNASDLYIINYGINDSNPSRTIGDRTGGPNYIGSSADINNSDPTQNANSFWGCMGRIVQSISNASPHSKIVLMTLMRFSSGRYDPFSEAIKDIAEYLGLPCVVIGNDPLFSSSFYDSHIDGGHPTVILYNAISHAFERQLNTAMVEYADYFNDFVGAGAE